MDLEIRCENGSMTVHLEEFLNICSITKVRKLLKLIRSSFTPECEQQIKKFVQDWIEQKQLENERYITGYEQKVSYCQKQLRGALYTRDGYKKSTPLHKSEWWDRWNEEVNRCREKLAEVKTLLRFYRSQYNSNVRNKDFYKKVMQEIT